AVWLVRREAIDQVGPADDSFFLFSEETDWAWRFRAAGWSLLFTPDAGATHVYAASHKGRMFVENLRGLLRFLRKHRGDAYAERARRLLLVSLRLRGTAFGASAASCTARARSGSHRGASATCSHDARRRARAARNRPAPAGARGRA